MFYRSSRRFTIRYDYTFRQHALMFPQPSRRIELVPPRSGVRPAKQTPGTVGEVTVGRRDERS